MSRESDATVEAEPATADEGTGDPAPSGRTDRGRATSIDVDARTMAALGYPVSFLVALVVVAGGEENEFVRFHAFQGVAYNVAGMAGWFALFLVGMVFAVLTVGFGMIIVAPLLVLAMVPLLAYLVYAAYRATLGDRYEIPYLAPFVDQYV